MGMMALRERRGAARLEGAFDNLMKHHVYMFMMQDGSIYTGSTGNLATRLKDHRRGGGGQTTGIPGSKKLIYSEEFPTRRSAIVRENQLKRWTRTKKLALATGNVERLRSSARRQGT